MNFYNDDFIDDNNERILLGCKMQPRYVHENKTQRDAQQKTKREPIDKEGNYAYENCKRFLMALYNCQYLKTLTEVCKIANFSACKGSRISKECVKKNLIKIIQVPFGRGRPKYPVILPEGYKFLDVEEKKFNGKGGFEHVLYQHITAEHFSDFKPVIELFRNGKNIDIGVETNEFLIAIEVAMTSVHEKENIEKDFSLAKADVVLVACINETVRNQVQNILSEMPEKIKKFTDVFLIAELLKKNPNEIIHNHQLKMNL